MINLSVKDRKLLHHLSENARQSYSQLGGSAGMSQTTARYRVERMVRQGIITGFRTLLNPASLGYDTFCLMLRLNKDLEEVSTYLAGHDSADWVVVLSGEHEIFAEFVCMGMQDARDIIEGVLERCQGAVNGYKVYFSSQPVRVEHLISSIYGKDIWKERRARNHEVDEVDRRMLSLLSEDSRLPLIETARSLGISLDIARYRLKKLLASGAIVKFFPEIDYHRLGFTTFMSTIRIKDFSSDKLAGLRSAIQNNTDVTYAFYDAMSSSFVFFIVLESPMGIDDVSRQLRQRFHGMIESQTYQLVKGQLLFNMYPKSLSSIPLR